MTIVSALALSLVLAFLGGKAAARLHVPKVTGYVLAGFVLGPSVLNWLNLPLQQEIHFIADLALGLILFNIGGKFDRELLRDIRGRTLRFSGWMAVGVGVTVAGLTALTAPWVSPLSGREGIQAGLYLGAVALAAAPPTTLMVIRECDSQGPVTRRLIVFLVVGTVLAIAGANTLEALFQVTGAWQGGERSAAGLLLGAAWSVLGAVAVGAVAGLLLSYWEQHEHRESELLLGVVCTILVGLMVSDHLHVEPMLVSLTIGFVLVNASPYGEHIHLVVQRMGLPVFALFFVLAGAHIQLARQFTAVGLLTAGYVLFRVAGFWAGSRLAARLSGEDPTLARQTGWGLLSHAGAALGIVTQLQARKEPAAQAIVETVFAAVVGFEIAGPILLRRCLLAAGEVKIASLVGQGVSGIKQSFGDLVAQCAHNLGLKGRFSRRSRPQSLKPFIRHKVLALDADATLDEVIKFISDHQFPVYPVVGAENRFEGVIGLNEVKNVMFDPFFARLVLASELVESRERLALSDSLEKALEIFAKSGRDHLPVVDPETGQYLGVVSHKELLLARQK
jgi:Kef-type K+ transport system membrane component KefB